MLVAVTEAVVDVFVVIVVMVAVVGAIVTPMNPITRLLEAVAGLELTPPIAVLE